MNRFVSVLLGLCFVLATASPTLAQKGGSCSSEQATSLFRKGFSAAEARNSSQALSLFRSCLSVEPDCVPCLYELGWVYWARSSWEGCVESWERVLELEPHHTHVKTWIESARDQLDGTGELTQRPLRVPVGTASSPEASQVELELTNRFQFYQSSPTDSARDRFDNDIRSPKSVRFSADGSKVYVNALEGFRTVVFDSKTLQKLSVIHHTFTAENEHLFRGEEAPFDYRFNRRPYSGKVNHFQGKPVESELSHEGKFLWVPYYRRDFDGGATSPSAVAIIDTETDQIVRVMPTGPIPKYVEASPDGNWVAVTHWGDNTVALIDTSSGNPQDFVYREDLMVVVKKLPQAGLAGENRDKACGYCLRGTVFTPDSKMLLVARMSGGGIAGFDVASGKYLGTVSGMKPTPRHLVLSHDGKQLYMSSNASGYVSKIPLAKVTESLKAAGGELVQIGGFETALVGSGARTVSLGPEGRYLFSAVNGASEVVVVEAATMKVVSRVRTDSFTVGLAVSPSGDQVWATSQGRVGVGGGNSVCIYSVSYGERAQEN